MVEKSAPKKKVGESALAKKLATDVGSNVAAMPRYAKTG